MKILIAMPLHGRLEIAAQAINQLTKLDSEHDLFFAFIITEAENALADRRTVEQVRRELSKKREG